MKKKTRYILLSLVAIVLLIVAYALNSIFAGFDIEKPVYIYINDKSNYDSLISQVEEEAKANNLLGFKTTAAILGYNKKMKAGRYMVTPEMTNLDLARTLYNGRQTPVQLKFNNIRTKQDLAVRISDQLMFDYNDLYTALDNTDICQKYGFTPETIVAMFIPNTYQYYWTVSVDDFLQRMNKEYRNFWNEDRLAKAKAIGLTPVEVSTLASIVEEECTYSDEYPTVARLYLNRLRVGQALQADPTVKFAVGDFSLRRILNIHLQTESPYNTYKHPGLPPGPIRIPSIKGIDSVLNATQHDYYYMCAKSDLSGRHDFSRTFAEHQRYAAQYRSELNKRNIR